MTVAEPMTRALRTYVIEPQTTFVPYLEHVLTGFGLEVVAVSSNVDAARIALWEPDIVIVDLDFVEKGGPSALCQVRGAAPRATILAYAENDDATFSAVCTIAGADAVLPKSSPAGDLEREVTRALTGR
jgi:DNA-binding NarL/FixJ family response regulator